ncbi:MAG: choice-of-anchor K domain-containing protein, partial [Verrucomicrobiota bacterium]
LPFMRISSSFLRKSEQWAFSILEMVTTVTFLGILATGSVVAINGYTKNAQEVKLQLDTATVNQAIKNYLAGGGSLTGETDPDAILTKLKKKATNANQIAGFAGSSIDKRLDAIVQTSAEAATGQMRAIWTPAEYRFVISDTGAVGVKEFEINEALANANYSTEEKDNSMDLATNSNWIWDYGDVTAAATARPTALSTAPPASIPPPPNPNPIGLLLPPTFSVPGGLYEPDLFPSEVTLTNPNDPAVSRLMFSINGSAWAEYNGDPITLTPGTVVSAYSMADDPEYYSSSVNTQFYESTDPIIAGTTSGVFKNPGGGSLMSTNLNGGLTNSYFEYGDGIAGGSGNFLDFTGASFDNVIPEELFRVGTLEYFNSTTSLGSAATDVTLEIELDIASMGLSEVFEFTLQLESTTNYSWMTADQQADFVRMDTLYSDFSATFDDETYYLNLQFGYVGADGFATLDQFHVHEGATASGDIFAYFSKDPMTDPGSSGSGTGSGGTPPPPPSPIIP